ncbi:hypothetical protein [Acidithiobacillus sulfurivorans]|uniref:Uncharacterized protein n=1 Tax=Acidithiobacillus sulfurivorans TaxID=1958756 RepID=A0ABS6A1E6_9PROT|nr:hypothetical protein [Acidithiobacillus sulfurivorans]MBU2761173.1 hypothetical protein [Acidithiobacillus sulfurivorans]
MQAEKEGQLLAFVESLHWPQALAILSKASTSLTLGITGGLAQERKRLATFSNPLTNMRNN